MSRYTITIHIRGSISDADLEALETDLYDGTLDLDNYAGLELPSYVETHEEAE